MQSIREIQTKTVGYFSAKGVPSPKLEADLLIAHVLGLKRLDLYLDIERPLTEAQLDELRPLVRRRGSREPLQYILGYGEFCGMRLKVTPATLIPRQETEELIEYLRDRIVTPPQSILDLGTGSGAVAIALSTIYPDARVTATDQSAEALAVAQENAESFVSNTSIHFKQGNWFDCIGGEERFDLIAANPPYLTEAEMRSAEAEVAGHEPPSALVAGPEGLNDLREIIAQTPKHLAPGGLLALETGIDQHAALDSLTQAAGLKGEGIPDLSGRPRFYFARA